MHVLHVVPGIQDEASGTTQSVRGLCHGAAMLGDTVTLAVLEPAPAAIEGVDVQVFPAWWWPRKIGVSPALMRALNLLSQEADVLHSHGLWMLPSVYPGAAARRSRARLIVSLHGNLSAYALTRSKWRKQVFWRLLQGRVVRSASCLHATSDREYHDIRAAGLSNPVCVIPNGVELPAPSLLRTAPASERTILFLGRLHPIKGVDLLLRAWSMLEQRWPEWVLDIVGPDEGSYGREMRVLAGALGLKRVHFLGPLYGAAKWAAYRDAEVFVLPTHSESFGIAVAEALAAGTPAVVTRGAPWAELEVRHAGWWIEHGVAPIVFALEQAMAEPRESLATRGARGRAWVEERFCWAAVAAQMQQTYRWLLDGDAPPSWVRLE